MRNPRVSVFLHAVRLLNVTACGASQKRSAGGEAELLTYRATTAEQTFSEVTVACPWELDNLSDGEVVVERARWTLALDGSEPVTGTTELNLRVAAKGKHEAKLKMTTPVNTSTEVLDAREEKPGVHYSVKATFELTGSEPYEADWFGEIYGSQRPEVTVKGRAGRHSDKSVELGFTVGIKNPNPFDVMVDGLDYKIFVDGQEVSSGELASGRHLDAASDLLFDIERALGLEDFQDLAKKVATSDVTPYRMDGTLRVSGVEIPVQLTGEFNFTK